MNTFLPDISFEEFAELGANEKAKWIEYANLRKELAQLAEDRQVRNREKLMVCDTTKA